MKQKAALVTSFYNNNEIFDISDKKKNRDNCLLPFYNLKNGLNSLGVDLSTSDINAQEHASLSIHFDYNIPPEADVNYLVIFESEVIKPASWNPEVYDAFDKVFTWHDELIDDKKFFKLNFVNDFPSKTNVEKWKPFNDRKLCTLIAGNKSVSHPLELYSERINAIRWFQDNQPDSFDLYGTRWDEMLFTNVLFRKAYNFLSLGRFIKSRKYPSYRGMVESKTVTLNNYKFSICYENAIDIPGYITEKIFDCLFAGCIPVYLGANNISDFVPKTCFIDKREFSSYDDLFKFLNNMTEDEAENYRSSIREFLFSEAASHFREDAFSKTLVHHIKQDLEISNQD